jgi:hypothetical protein
VCGPATTTASSPTSPHPNLPQQTDRIIAA